MLQSLLACVCVYVCCYVVMSRKCCFRSADNLTRVTSAAEGKTAEMKQCLLGAPYEENQICGQKNILFTRRGPKVN